MHYENAKLLVLKHDVKNPRKRDKRMTRDWTHDEVIKAGTHFKLLPAWRNDEHRGPAELRKLGSYDRCTENNTEYTDQGLLFEAIVAASDVVPDDKLGAVLVRYDYAAKSLDEVLAVLLANGDVKREAVISAIAHVEKNANREGDEPEAKAHEVIVRAEYLR